KGYSLKRYNTLLENKILKNYCLSKVCRYIFERLNQKEIELVVKELKQINNVFHLDNAFKGPLNIIKTLLFLLQRDFTGISRLSMKVVRALFARRVLY
ncbi:MAG: hypothetical protein DRO01_07765, partial [Thermoproteota archaeon]